MSVIHNVASAGASAVLTVSCIHPMDVIKTRLQISGQGARNYKSLGIRKTVATIWREEGVSAFWKGIQPAWFREASYTSLRLGLYDPIKRQLDSSFFSKFVAGSLAGCVGSLAGNPFDVVKTRMMSFEGKTAPPFSEQVRWLYAREGAVGFYKGIQANLLRACVLNGTKMACYDQLKEYLESRFSAGLGTQFGAAFGAGFLMALTVSPFDMVRTQLMNGQSSSVVSCVRNIVQRNGVRGLYAGFLPIWFRFAPTTCLQLVLFEQIKNIFPKPNNKKQ